MEYSTWNTAASRLFCHSFCQRVSRYRRGSSSTGPSFSHLAPEAEVSRFTTRFLMLAELELVLWYNNGDVASLRFNLNFRRAKYNYGGSRYSAIKIICGNRGSGLIIESIRSESVSYNNYVTFVSVWVSENWVWFPTVEHLVMPHELNINTIKLERPFTNFYQHLRIHAMLLLLFDAAMENLVY